MCCILAAQTQKAALTTQNIQGLSRVLRTAVLRTAFALLQLLDGPSSPELETGIPSL